MSVEARHDEILILLQNSSSALSGSFLSKEVGVSRQIIVQDINQLREAGHSITSTPKGYVLDRSWEVQKIVKVYHTVEDTEKELNLIVDLGADVKDVFIFHKIYGEIHAPLNIRSRKDVKDFCDKIKKGKSSPLMTATAGYHYHTLAARDKETLELVEKELKKKGFIAKRREYEPESMNKSNNN